MPIALHSKHVNARWERIDADCAGCLLCGCVHICKQYTKNSQHGITYACVIEETEENTVCAITGYCVRNIAYTYKEYVDTVALDTDKKQTHKNTDFDDVFPYVFETLCSDTARNCHNIEEVRTNTRIQQIMFKLLREFKIKYSGTLPNIIEIVTLLSDKLHNARMCKTAFDITRRTELCQLCTKYTCRLLYILRRTRNETLTNMKMHTIVIGVLYLMRSGLVLHDLTILPQIPQLVNYLPLESNLAPFFGVRCKAITEVENMIKINIRSLTTRQVHALGISCVDKLIV